MSELMNIPNLRFPDFSDDWQVSKLGDVTSKIGSGSTPRGGEEVYTSDGILFIRSQNVKRNILDLTDSTFIPEEVHFQMSGSEVKSNDVLLNITGASIGRSCVVPSSVITGNVNQHVCIVRTGRHLEPNFLQPFLASRRGQKLIYQGQTGSGREGLNFQSIRSFKLSLPTKPEQQKIAAFLTAVDNKIEQLSKKQALLGEYKKGLTQQIFSQAIRFKADDGSDFPDWKEKKLENVLKRTSTGLNPRQNFKLGYGENYYVTIKNISNGKLDFSKCERIDENAMTMIANRSDLSKGDLIMSSIGNVGESYLLDKEPENWNINESVFMLRASELMLPQFLYFIITNEQSKWYLESNSTGSSFKSIKLGELKLLPLGLPSLEEQTKIANFLSSIDTKIEQVGKQLDESKQFKKALLQQMFV